MTKTHRGGDRTPSRAVRLDAVPGWSREAEVVVVGYGGAGASAAIEAARAGAETQGSS